MKSHIVDISDTLLQALAKLNALSGQAMTLFAIDNDGKLKGTLTDGDVRRALLKGISLDSPVSAAMHCQYRSLSTKRKTDVAALRQFRKERIKLVPCVDDEGRLCEILDLDKMPTQLPLSAIIMAGGKGERLRPLTFDTPKPLLKIGGKAIIDYNIEALLRCGIKDIYVTVNYLAEKIEAHIATQPWAQQVHCIYESQPLGTIGAAALAPLPQEGETLVMNSDILTTMSFEDMYLHHNREHADVTIAAIPYQVSVPYAILSIGQGDAKEVTGIEEKPSYSYFANAGIYIFPNKMLLDLPKGQRTDATDLLEQSIQERKRVTYYPINGTWIDIGSPADYRQATELMDSINEFNNNLI